ncbi:MAG: lipopolysaccharide heptosyltransferase II [Simkaniaceae bacterium]
MPNWIGDLVMATPLLQDIRGAYPKAEITAMVKKPLSELLLKDPNINELFSFSKSGKFFRRDEKCQLIEKLRKGKYDLGLLTPNSFSSAYLFWQGRVERRVGFKGHFRRYLLTDVASTPQKVKAQHLVKTYKALLKPLSIPLSKTAPKLYLEEEEKNRAWALLKRFSISSEMTLIGINPGAAYGSAKCWLPERFATVAKKLVERDSNVVVLFFGDRSHWDLIKKICSNLPPRVLNLAGLTTLRELMALISLCRAFITNDSGPMHVAEALGIPLVALFGSTDEVVTGPYEKGEVIHKHVNCSPCFNRICPIDFRCMKEIASDEVLEKIYALLEKKL